MQKNKGVNHQMNKKTGFTLSRREAIKYILYFACALSMFTPTLATGASEESIVVFFSWSGNTRKVAETIANETGASLLELKTVTPYPAGYSDAGAVAKKEWQENDQTEAFLLVFRRIFKV